MIKKLIISACILALGVIGYQLLNRDDGKSARKPTGRPPATQPKTEATSEPKTPSEDTSLPKPDNAANKPEAKKETKNTSRGGTGMRTGTLAKQDATSVEVIRIQAIEHTATLDVFGVVEAQTSAVINATSSATVKDIIRREGDAVKADEQIVAMSSATTEEQLQQRQAALIELDARIRNESLKHKNDLDALNIERELLRIAKNSVDRFTSLNAQQLSSSTDYEAALRTYQSQLLSTQSRELTIAQYDDSMKQLQAQRDLLQSQVRQSEQLVDELTVSAPFDGLVAKISVIQGQEIRAADPIVTVYDPNTLALYVRVPLRYRLDKTNLNALTATDHQGGQWQAIAIRPVNESGAQRLTLQPINREAINVLPGSHLSLSLHYPITEPSIDVPVTSVYDQKRVYVFDKNSSTLQAVDVEILGQSETGYLISAAPFEDKAIIIKTRMKNPLTGMPVSIAKPSRGK